MSLDDSIRTLVRAELRSALAEMFQGDRRAAPRPKGRQRPAKRCPVKGCRNAFAPRFGGYCEDHRGTAGYKAWAAKSAAKKR